MGASTQLRTKIISGLFFLLILAVLFIKIKTLFNFYDEGFALFDSMRVFHGDAPYKDFWGIYPPGQFYAIAGIYKLFGTNLLPTRIYDTLVRFLLVIGVYLVTKKITSYPLALLAALIAGLILASAGFYSYAVFPALCLGVWAIWGWLKFAETGKNRWLPVTGIILGVAAAFRWDIGIYAAISIMVGGYLYLLACAAAERNSGASAKRSVVTFKRLLSPLKHLSWMFGPALAIALLEYGYITIRSGWSNLYDQVFYFPAIMLHSVRWVAYPPLIPDGLRFSPDWQRFYLPIVVLVPAATWCAFRYVRNREPFELRFYATISLILCAALLFNQALSRYDYIHVIPASILTFMVCVSLFYQAMGRLNRSQMKVIPFLLLSIPTFVYFYPAYKELSSTIDSFPPWGCYSHLKIASCALVDPNQEQAVEYIQAHTRPQDTIYVGNQRHDKIFVNDVGFYYLAGRLSATRYSELHPGVATTLPVQQEIASELEARKPQWIVLVGIWDSNEPNGSAVSSGVYYLDDYLRSHYSPRDFFGMYEILERK